MWRARRQFTIVAICITAILLFIVLPYWYLHREVPTCFDREQNQGEVGVDCGGPCALLCKGGAKEVQILWAKAFPVRQGVYDLVAYVENPNIDIGAPRLPYVGKLFDAEGNVIAEKAGETYANPSERFAIFSGNMYTGEKVPASGQIEISTGFPWVTIKTDKRSLFASDKVLTGTDKTPKLSAIVTSGETEILRNIDVTVVIKDSTGEPIAVSATKIEKIDPKGSEKIFFTWPAPFNYKSETEQCETPVDVVLALDRSGSMASEGKNPPQPLTEAKNAAARFVERLTTSDQVAYVSFATVASKPIDQILTKDIARLQGAIDRTAIGKNGLQFTNIGDALRVAIDELTTFRKNESARSAIVLLTDGLPTRPEDPTNPANKEYPAIYARTIAEEAKTRDIAVYTIGLGDEVDENFLMELSNKPEYYYKAASGADLGAIYQQIASAICKKGPSVIEIIPRVNLNARPLP